MAASIFRALCDICNDLDHTVLALEPGEAQDRLMVLVQRLDEAIDRTIGLEEATAHEENSDDHLT